MRQGNSPNAPPTVALVSMPWMAAGLPSIQLATLAATLQREQIPSTSYELYLDYAARIGLNLYNILSNAGGFLEEWLFARHYYRFEAATDLTNIRTHRPSFGLQSRDLEDQVLDALIPVTDGFLDELAQRPEWATHDIVAFSLTISQTAASMALARLLKRRYPTLIIICGGSSCAGPMGQALLRVCPYVDVVVSIEGELVFPELVRRVRSSVSLDGMAGVIWREPTGQLRGTTRGPLLLTRDHPGDLRYDHYFKRLEAVGLRDRIQVWLPFESSRGCWWGEKHQCTFCGLNEVMRFRVRSPESVLRHLEVLADSYKVTRFFAVDLIMPRDYLKSLLPEIVKRGYNWTLFYEIKANLKRADVELLAAAGVRWIQPGIESLDDRILRLMQKGVTALQNIQLLKWCREVGIHVTWNVITGTPGEPPDAYASMAGLIPSLFHLTPPSGASPFQLHRFSPYFEDPGKYGIKGLRAHPLYQDIFPIQQTLLDELVYLYDYSVDRSVAPEVYTQSLGEVVARWRAARERGAVLEYQPLCDGRATIRDSRQLPARRHRLGVSEAALYRFLDGAMPEGSLERDFAEAHPREVKKLIRSRSVLRLLDAWEAEGLVVRDEGRVLGLATRKRRAAAAQRPSELEAPVAYLGERVAL